MKVKCIHTSGTIYLDRNKIYEVLDQDEERYTVLNSGDNECKYKKYRFEVVFKYHNPPRKHAEQIKAWAEGADIQCRNSVREEWAGNDHPFWYENHLYRVKPTVNEEGIARLEATIKAAKFSIDKAQDEINKIKSGG